MISGKPIGLLLALGACAPVTIPPPATQTLIETQDVRVDQNGRCFASYATGDPVMTTGIEQVEVVPAEYDADGMLVSPPVFRNEQVTREAIPAPTAEFEMVCPPALTPELIGNLQRALTVRGLYSGPVTGQLDPATSEAIRLFQFSNLAINSRVLSLAAAQELGLVSLSEAQINALQ